MTFEQDYNRLLDCARGEIRFKNLINIEPEEIVSDIYVSLIDEAIEYSFSAAKKIASKICCNLKKQPPIVEFERSEWGKPKNKYYSENSRPCKYCSEEKPINCFYVYPITNVRTLICNDCEAKRRKKRYDEKEKNNADIINRQRIWEASNRERINLRRRLKYIPKLKKEKIVKITAPKTKKLIKEKPPKIIKLIPVKEKKIKVTKQKIIKIPKSRQVKIQKIKPDYLSLYNNALQEDKIKEGNNKINPISFLNYADYAQYINPIIVVLNLKTTISQIDNALTNTNERFNRVARTSV